MSMRECQPNVFKPFLLSVSTFLYPSHLYKLRKLHTNEEKKKNSKNQNAVKEALKDSLC